MLLKNKNAIVYGGGGAIGGAVASAFAAEGARVFLAGRKLEPLDAVAGSINDRGGNAETAIVDALDKQAVDRHAAGVVEKAGSIDISFNAIGVVHIQGVALADLSPEEYFHPIRAYAMTNFLTATAAARHMMKRRSGVIFTISTPGSLLASAVAGGFGVSNAAVEGLTRQLAGELGPHGIRVICLRPDAIPEATWKGSHSHEVFSHRAKVTGTTLEEMMAGAPAGTLLQRSPTLVEVGNTAAFLASDKASAITATVANLTCGSVVDYGIK